MRERAPDSSEIAILRAIACKDMFKLPKDYHPADMAWLSLYGYVKLGPGKRMGALYWPENATLTDKGRDALTKS